MQAVPRLLIGAAVVGIATAAVVGVVAAGRDSSSDDAHDVVDVDTFARARTDEREQWFSQDYPVATYTMPWRAIDGEPAAVAKLEQQAPGFASVGNRDGRYTVDEVRQAVVAFDANGDRALDPTEQAAYQAIFGLSNLSQDSVLSRSEDLSASDLVTIQARERGH